MLRLSSIPLLYPTSHLCCKGTFVSSVYPSTFPPNAPHPHPSSILTPRGAEPWQCLHKRSLRFLSHVQLWTPGSAESSQSGLANQRSVSLQMRWGWAFFSHKLGMGWETARSSENRHESTATSGIFLKCLYIRVLKKPSSLWLSPASHQSGDWYRPDLNSCLSPPRHLFLSSPHSQYEETIYICTRFYKLKCALPMWQDLLSPLTNTGGTGSTDVDASSEQVNGVSQATEPIRLVVFWLCHTTLLPKAFFFSFGSINFCFIYFSAKLSSAYKCRVIFLIFIYFQYDGTYQITIVSICYELPY